MSSRHGAPAGWFAAVMLAILLFPGTAAAQDAAFKDGMKAFDDGKWTAAADALRRALMADEKDANRGVEYGGFLGLNQQRKLYLPHYFLGYALLKLGDCSGAVEQWSTSEKYGVVNTVPAYVREMQIGFAFCETKGVLPPAKFDPLWQRALQRYNEANTLAQSVNAMGQQNLDEYRSDLREQYDRARRELEAARTALTAASRSRTAKDFDAAAAATDRGQSILVTVQTTLRGLIDTKQSAQSLAREVEGLLSSADALERELDTRLAGRRPALPGSLASVRQNGRDALGRARDQLAAGTRNRSVPALTEARTLAVDGTRSYRQLLDELTRLEQSATARQLQDVTSAVEQSWLMFDGLTTTLQKRIAANSGLVDAAFEEERAAIEKEAGTARRRFALARASSNLAGLEQARELTTRVNERLNALLSRFGPLTLRERGVSAALEEGASLFFAGEYRKALAALDAPEAVAPDAPLQLHVHLFRAAALYAESARGGDDVLRRRARAEVAECRRLDSRFEPDPRAFSPAFIRFFKMESAPVAGGAQ